MKLLIDADTLLYTCCAAVEKAIQWEDNVWSFSADGKEARERIQATVAGWLKELNADSALMALSGDGECWRRRVLPSYKNSRTGRKPVCYADTKEWLKETYVYRMYATLEGDDVLGTIATNPVMLNQCVVVSIDKDLKTIPGMHYNPTKDEEVRTISLEEADRWHLYQTLMGDRVDGYTGCPGIGAVGANRLLDKDCSWATVVSAYKSKGLGEAEALVQARVARILRHGEYDRKTGQVTLWNPTR